MKYLFLYDEDNSSYLLGQQQLAQEAARDTVDENDEIVLVGTSVEELK